MNSTLYLTWTWLAIGGQAIASSGGSDVASPDVLQAIGDRMRQVQHGLLAADSDGETRATQMEIADRLRELIESLEAQHQNQLSPQDASRQDQPPPSADPDAAAGTEAAQDSTPGTGQADEPVEDATAILQQAAGSVWGHLPERYRARMRSAEGVEFLPRYRTLIEDYYRRLAEDRGRTP